MFFSLFFNIQRVMATTSEDPNQSFLSAGQAVFYSVDSPETCKFAKPSNESDPSAGSFLVTADLSVGSAFGSQAITTTTGHVFLNETVFPRDYDLTFIAKGESLVDNSAYIAGPECLSGGEAVVTYLDSVTMVCNGGSSVQTIPANLVNGQANFPTPNGSYSCIATYNFLAYGQQDDCLTSGTCTPIAESCPLNPYFVSLAQDPSGTYGTGNIVVYQGDTTNINTGGFYYRMDANGDRGYRITIQGCLPGASCSGASGDRSTASDEWPDTYDVVIDTSPSTPVGTYVQGVLIEDLADPSCRTTVAANIKVEPSRKSVCDGTWRKIPPAPLPYSVNSNPLATFDALGGQTKVTYDGQRINYITSCSNMADSVRATYCRYLDGSNDACTWDRPSPMDYTLGGNPTQCPPAVLGWTGNSGSPAGTSSSWVDSGGRTYEVRKSSSMIPAFNNPQQQPGYYMEYKCENSSPPSVSNLTFTEPNYCTAGPSAFVNWTYSSLQGKPQSAYQVQVDDQASFQNPELDSGKVLSNGTSYFATPLQFNVTYRVRVRVWDSSDVASPWVVSQSWKTPAHAYPAVDFTWSPLLNPSAKQSIQFTDLSVFYDGTGVGQRGWSWLFGDAGTSNVQNPSHTYNNFGSYNITETVTDKDGFSCSLSKPINIERPIPAWKEVSPK
ncbi:MAG: PKD domain-containing protein [Patescibacteria group bacterium]